MRTARGRYVRSLMLLMASYALSLFGVASFFTNHPGATNPVAYVIAALPAVPIIGVFIVIGRYLHEEPDEYVRLLLVRQALIATGFALSIATMWGFLENFRLVPHIYAYYAAILWFAGLGVGGLVNAVIEHRAR